MVDKEILIELKHHARKHNSLKDAFIREKHWEGRPNLQEYIIVKNGLNFEEIINNSKFKKLNIKFIYGGR